MDKDGSDGKDLAIFNFTRQKPLVLGDNEGLASQCVLLYCRKVWRDGVRDDDLEEISMSKCRFLIRRMLAR